jgi:hypothetical protein
MFFKSTYNIFVKPDEDEVYNNDWANFSKVQYPPNKKWDYKKELTIEDVDIWEQIYYQSGGLGLYASWNPYAEFYMITHHLFMYKTNSVETFYGPMAGEKAFNRAKELGMPVEQRFFWVEDEDMWLYSEENLQNKIIIL